MWPNNHLNRLYHREQLSIIDALLPDVEGRTVLDIGCGIGRMAAGLACYLDPLTGRYHGFDPVPKGIAWCNQAFAAYPHFRFEQADVFNEHYWPQGRVLATDYHFPLPDWSVDFAIATSVFTHLYYEEVEAYLKEAARVLKPEGVLFSTFLLFDGERPPRRGARGPLTPRVRGADARASITAARSGGSGALRLTVPPRGHSKLTLEACRNMRERPNFPSAAFASASPYFASPATGWPAYAACTRIWCVRPVLIDTSRSDARLPKN